MLVCGICLAHTFVADNTLILLMYYQATNALDWYTLVLHSNLYVNPSVSLRQFLHLNTVNAGSTSLHQSEAY